METVEYGDLIKDTIQLNLSTQEDSCILLNGSKRSKAFYDIRSYIDFENDDSIQYITLQMPYAVITNSNYIFSQYNNTVVVSYLSNTYTYTIPFGNYTVSTFISYLATNVFQTTSGFAITFNQITNKLKISYSGGGTWGFLSGTTCDYNIGFKGTITSTTNEIVMPFPVDFLPIPRFIFHCNLINSGLTFGTNSKISNGDVLASIPNNAKLNSQIIYENTSSEFILRSISNDGITITITNDNEQEIDFNNIACYFVLTFNIFRKNIKRTSKFNTLIQKIKSSNMKLVGDDVILEE